MFQEMWTLDSAPANRCRRFTCWFGFRHFWHSRTSIGGENKGTIQKSYHFCMTVKSGSIQPTYPRIPDAGLTQLNFINTLPCPINISYTAGNNQVEWTVVNATSYSFERNLKDQTMQVTARLINPVCGQVNFSTPTWTGMIKGASTKVNINAINRNMFHINQSTPSQTNNRDFPLSPLETMAPSIWFEWITKNHWINPVRDSRGLGKSKTSLTL